MKNSNQYKRYRFPAEIIQYAVWLYYRFNLSHRDIKDLLAQRFLNVHSAVYNLFNLGRHLVSAAQYRLFRMRAFVHFLEETEIDSLEARPGSKGGIITDALLRNTGRGR